MAVSQLFALIAQNASNRANQNPVKDFLDTKLQVEEGIAAKAHRQALIFQTQLGNQQKAMELESLERTQAAREQNAITQAQTQGINSLVSSGFVDQGLSQAKDAGFVPQDAEWEADSEIDGVAPIIWKTPDGKTGVLGETSASFLRKKALAKGEADIADIKARGALAKEKMTQEGKLNLEATKAKNKGLLETQRFNNDLALLREKSKLTPVGEKGTSGGQRVSSKGPKPATLAAPTDLTVNDTDRKAVAASLRTSDVLTEMGDDKLKGAYIETLAQNAKLVQSRLKQRKGSMSEAGFYKDVTKILEKNSILRDTGFMFGTNYEFDPEALDSVVQAYSTAVMADAGALDASDPEAKVLIDKVRSLNPATKDMDAQDILDQFKGKKSVILNKIFNLQE